MFRFVLFCFFFVVSSLLFLFFVSFFLFLFFVSVFFLGFEPHRCTDSVEYVDVVQSAALERLDGPGGFPLLSTKSSLYCVHLCS